MGYFSSFIAGNDKSAGRHAGVFRLPAIEEALPDNFSFVIDVSIEVLIEIDYLVLIERPIHGVKACPDEPAHPFRLILRGHGDEHVCSAIEAELNDTEICSMPRVLDFDLVEAIDVALLEAIHSYCSLDLHPWTDFITLHVDVALVYDFYAIRIGLDAVLVYCKRRLSFCFVLRQSSHFLLQSNLLVSLLFLCLLHSHLFVSLLFDLLLFELKLFPLQLHFLLFQFLLIKKLLFFLPFKTHLFAHHLLLDVSVIGSYLILSCLLGLLRIVLGSRVWLDWWQLNETAVFVVRHVPNDDLLTHAAGSYATRRTDYYRPAAGHHASRWANAHSASHHAIPHPEAAHTHHASVHHAHSHVHLHRSYVHVHSAYAHHFGPQKRPSHGHVHSAYTHVHSSDSHVHGASVHHAHSQAYVHSEHSILLI